MKISNNITYAESYYFKECKLSSSVTGNYIINFDQNIIEVKLEAVDGTIQNFEDKIKLVEKNKIVSDKIKSAKGEKIYYQYHIFPLEKQYIAINILIHTLASRF